MEARPLYLGENPLEISSTGPGVRKASHYRLDDAGFDPLDRSVMSTTD